jgi:aspartyl/asparaginyl beta-hydroxylase (cupin superfamily)
MKLMRNIPNVVNICFNVIEPNSKIVPHSGDTNAIVSCDLGLIIPPTTLLVAIKVKDDVRGLETGKTPEFIDA